MGIMFTLANSIAVSMYTIGFCESLLDVLNQYVPNFTGLFGPGHRLDDIRVIGVATLMVLIIIAIAGMSFVNKVQMVLLALLLSAQLDFIVGTFITPSEEEIDQGFVGYNLTLLSTNLWSGYTDDFNCFKVFAVFFPAVTGIVAGANLSGELKDPGRAIPKGTLLAILTTFASYVIYGFMIASCGLRQPFEGDCEY